MEKEERAVHVEFMGEKEMLTAILRDAEVQNHVERLMGELY
jgi:hypothetical protein